MYVWMFSEHHTNDLYDLLNKACPRTVHDVKAGAHKACRRKHRAVPSNAQRLLGLAYEVVQGPSACLPANIPAEGTYAGPSSDVVCAVKGVERAYALWLPHGVHGFLYAFRGAQVQYHRLGYVMRRPKDTRTAEALYFRLSRSTRKVGKRDSEMTAATARIGRSARHKMHLVPSRHFEPTP